MKTNTNSSPKRKSPAFNAYLGLHTMLAPSEKAASVEPIQDLLNAVSSKKESVHTETCDILILDTYLKGSFTSKDMKELLSYAKSEAVERRGGVFRILLLDPESESGRSRARLLRSTPPPDTIANAIEMLDESLTEIINGVTAWVNGHLETPTWPADPKLRAQAKIDYINGLSKFESFDGVYPIELRLYSVFTESPVYIVDNFVAKGLLLSNLGASKSCWLVFVNDFFHDDDMFDIFRNNFNAVWRNATTKIGSTSTDPRFFIVWGASSKSKKWLVQIQKQLRTWGLICEYMKEDPSLGNLHEIFRQKANECDGVIAIHCEDMEGRKTTDPDQKLFKHASLNVLIETGYFWSKVSIDRCIIFKCGEAVLPPDIQGRTFVDPSNGNWKGQLADMIKARWNISLDGKGPEPGNGTKN